MKRRSFLAGILGLPTLALAPFAVKAAARTLSIPTGVKVRVIASSPALGAPFTTTLAQTQYDAYACAAGAAMGKQIDDIILGVL